MPSCQATMFRILNWFRLVQLFQIFEGLLCFIGLLPSIIFAIHQKYSGADRLLQMTSVCDVRTQVSWKKISTRTTMRYLSDEIRKKIKILAYCGVGDQLECQKHALNCHRPTFFITYVLKLSAKLSHSHSDVTLIHCLRYLSSVIQIDDLTFGISNIYKC